MAKYQGGRISNHQCHVADCFQPVVALSVVWIHSHVVPAQHVETNGFSDTTWCFSAGACFLECCSI